MSSIGALSPSSRGWSTTQTQRPSGAPPGGGPAKTNSAVADLLGIGSDTVQTPLDGGTTMTAPAHRCPLGQGADIASGAIGPGGPSGGPPPEPPVDAQSGIEALFEAFGISADDLSKGAPVDGYT